MEKALVAVRGTSGRDQTAEEVSARRSICIFKTASDIVTGSLRTRQYDGQVQLYDLFESSPEWKRLSSLSGGPVGATKQLKKFQPGAASASSKQPRILSLDRLEHGNMTLRSNFVTSSSHRLNGKGSRRCQGDQWARPNS